MLRIKTTIIAFAFIAICFASVPSEACADGPLRRWIRGLWRPNTSCNQQVGQYQPTVANYTPNAYNLQPGQCMKTCQQTCSRTVVNYVPYTAYRTVTNRVPVTQYRPETSSDPCTGCTVTCMKPCTTYTYQVQRVPYTTYRPVYRQESYKVPVTTITNGCETGTCATGNCGLVNAGCDSCGTGYQNPVMAPQPNYAPTAAPAPQTNTYYESAPGTISTGGAYGSTTGGYSTPADQAPVLQGISPTSTQRPVLDRLNNNGYGQDYQASNQNDWNGPARIKIQETVARSPVHKQWSYSPVRLASYEQPVEARAETTRSLRLAPARSSWTTEETPVSRQPAKRNGWVEFN